jgi:hypothetical protein
MLVDERIRVAAMSLGQVDQERQKPGKRGWHGIDQIIHRVAFIAGRASNHRIKVAIYRGAGLLYRLGYKTNRRLVAHVIESDAVF